jgi:D-serine deaminase-like pyridoxal phosphate-dependent protein
MGLAELKARVAREFGTPALVIDLDVVATNIARAQAYCDAAGVANRPHIKTHKSPMIAAMQHAGGAKGITCQKVGEAEVMAEAGLDDILISYNIFGTEKTGRLGNILKHKTVTVAADNPTVVAGLPHAAAVAGRSLPVVVECDTGRKRAGVETPGEALELADRIVRSEGLSFAGFMFYPPETAMRETQAFLDTVRAGLAARGLPQPAIVSTGGTPNLRNLGKIAGTTEHRAGTCIYNDRMMLRAGMATEADCALNVYATVVSRAAPERGILDAGSKTLTSDPGGGLDGFGHILEHPEARIGAFAEEHGFLDFSRCNDRPKVGDLVRIIPNHVCVTVNMFDRFIAVRGGNIVGEFPVAARGKLT